MDETKWISVLITAFLGSAFICFLILLINESGKRGQAITWLPASLAATVAVTHVTSPNELARFLQTAFGALFISGIFIMTFYFLIESILPSNPKNITSEKQNTILIIAIILSLIIPGGIVFLVEAYAAAFWSLILGFFGLGLVIVNVLFSKRLNFKENKIKLGIVAAICCKCCKRKISRKEFYMLIGAVIGTFTFVIVPAILADAGNANWAGIIANAPKITVAVMVSLWINRPAEITAFQTEELKQEMEEHLTMFSYSTAISAIYIVIMWWNETQQTPENFWWAWSITLVLSLFFIAGILIPVCLQSSKIKKVELAPSNNDATSEEKVPLVSSILQTGDSKYQGDFEKPLYLKW